MARLALVGEVAMVSEGDIVRPFRPCLACYCECNPIPIVLQWGRIRSGKRDFMIALYSTA